MDLRVVLLIATVGCTRGDWRTDPEWSFQTYLGGEIELHCNDTVAKVMENDMVEWHSPKGERIMGSEKYMLSDVGNVRGLSLMVKDVQHDDSGVYICKIYRDGDFQLKLNRGINLYESKYKDAFDKYRYNVLVGGVAAAALFVPLVVICFVYKMRFRTEEERETSRKAKMIRKRMHSLREVEAGELPVKTAPQNGAGNINPAYTDESTKL